jgi:hypothetical protein
MKLREILRIKDRLLRGAFAGVLAGLILLTWNLFSHYILHFAKKTWLEVLNQLIMGHSLKEAWIMWLQLVFYLFGMPF